MTEPFDRSKFDELPLVGILRAFDAASIRPLVRACLEGGLTNLEITMNSPGAGNLIRMAREESSGAMNIGAGTVIDPNTLEEALAAGACFIVTPNVRMDVIGACRERKIPVIPGAMSPSEIHSAWSSGATAVKVFPAESLGPSFIKAVKAPLPNIKLIPTGGVDLTTIRPYLDAGADGFGIGSPIFNRERVEAADWQWIKSQCLAFKRAYREGCSDR